MSYRRTTKRIESNETLMQGAQERYGYLSIRIAFSIKDKEGAYRGLKGKAIVVRKIPGAGTLDGLLGRIEEVIRKFAKERK